MGYGQMSKNDLTCAAAAGGAPRKRPACVNAVHTTPEAAGSWPASTSALRRPNVTLPSSIVVGLIVPGQDYNPIKRASGRSLMGL